MTNAEIIKLETGIPNKNFSLIGDSLAFKGLIKEIEKAVKYDVDVLLLGKTGTGKENVARAIHLKSKRSEFPFVAVNSVGLTISLAESLFSGHAKGSFTGATGDQKGYFEQAHGGTILLDEIGDMPFDLQAKLLRILERKTIQPLGSEREKAVDVRIISATNVDLEKEVEEGRFRKDLYYRLSVFPIEIPSLRDRKEDIPLLAEYFIGVFNKEYGMNKSIDKKAMELMKIFFWDGNIRQLKNVILRAMIDCEKDTISIDNFPGYLTEAETKKVCPICRGKLSIDSIDEMQKMILLKALFDAKGNIAATARILGLSVKTCHNWAVKYFGSPDSARKEARF